MGKRFRKMDAARERVSSRECERLQNRERRWVRDIHMKLRERENEQIRYRKKKA